MTGDNYANSTENALCQLATGPFPASKASRGASLLSAQEVRKKRYNSDCTRSHPSSGMRQFFPILVLVCSAWPQSARTASRDRGFQVCRKLPTTRPSPPTRFHRTRKIRAQGQGHHRSGHRSVGGETYLTIRDREQQGRGYGFHLAVESGGGVPFLELLGVSRQGARSSSPKSATLLAIPWQQGIRTHLQRRTSA